MYTDPKRAGLVAVFLWLMAPALLALLAAFSLVFTAWANSSTVTAQVCRANVEPCQQVINIPEGGTVALDLFLNGAASGNTSNPLQVAAWQAHYQLADTSVAELVATPSSGEPVQEQGDGKLALEGLARLQSKADEGVGQYYTVQNQYNPGSGQLDYAVTLLRFNPAKPLPRVLPFSNQAQLLLGRVILKGVAPGSTDLVAGDSAGTSFQAVMITSSGKLEPLGVAFNTPLATINVGTVTNPELAGQVAASPSTTPALFPLELAITFWTEDAIPPWQGGNAQSAAAFYNVTTDEQGIFRITDIPPSVLPPGSYDLRIKPRRALATLTQGITFPASSNTNQPPLPIPVNLGDLQDGDVDGNNIVDNLDLLALTTSFGRLAGEAEFNDNANFNGDSVVDAQDFSRLARNFNRRGE